MSLPFAKWSERIQGGAHVEFLAALQKALIGWVLRNSLGEAEKYHSESSATNILGILKDELRLIYLRAHPPFRGESDLQGRASDACDECCWGAGKSSGQRCFWFAAHGKQASPSWFGMSQPWERPLAGQRSYRLTRWSWLQRTRSISAAGWTQASSSPHPPYFL